MRRRSRRFSITASSASAPAPRTSWKAMRAVGTFITSRNCGRSLKARDAYIGIADPTRRAILDLLRDDGALIAGDIAAAFDDISRPGVSRHLRVLRECGLLTAKADGKERIYTL